MKITSMTSDGMTFDDGSKLTDYHQQDCCEKVYADWDGMKAYPLGCTEYNYLNLEDLDFFEDILSSIVPIPDLGFYIVTKQGICLMVSCYDMQNGYYNSDLFLHHVKDEYIVKKLNISDYVKADYGY